MEKYISHFQQVYLQILEFDCFFFKQTLKNCCYSFIHFYMNQTKHSHFENDI